MMLRSPLAMDFVKDLNNFYQTCRDVSNKK